MFQGIQCVVHGADHIKANKICQDWAGVSTQESYAVAVVSDGHGGTKYIRSEIGSKLAVEAAIETVDVYMKEQERFHEALQSDPDYVLGRMERYFITKWNQKIEDYNDAHELNEKEQEILQKVREKSSKETDWHSYYGCTVLIAVLAEGYSYGMLVGDGTYAVVYEDGSVAIPIDDPYSVANMTSSVCDKQSIDKFQHYYEEKQPLSITVSSDGLCKSFGSEESLKDYHVRLTYMMNTEQFKNSLEKNLNTFTKKGSGDDISVASVFDPEILTEKKTMLYQVIEEKKKEEQARREAEEKRLAEVKRQMELAREAEERRRQQEEERRCQEEQRRREAEERRRMQEELRRQEAERRRQEEIRRQEELRRRRMPIIDVIPLPMQRKATLDQQLQDQQRRADQLESMLKVQKEQSQREKELMERELQLQRDRAELERAQRELLEQKSQVRQTNPLDERFISVRDRMKDQIISAADRLEASAREMEDMISRKLMDQADEIAANSDDDIKET